MASYNVFDFGKRDRTIEERSVQVGHGRELVGIGESESWRRHQADLFRMVRARQVREMTQRAQSPFVTPL